MVISCPECSTKFRVNPDRIPASGAKVRCARCKHVFLAEKPAPEEAPVFEDVPLTEDEPTAAVSEPVSEPDPTPESPTPQPTFTAQVPAAEQPIAPDKDTGESFTVADNTEESFSYEQFRELDSTETEDDNFTFGSEEENTEQFEAATEAGAVDSDAEETFSFSAPTDEMKAAETAKEQEAEKIEPEPVAVEEAIENVFAEVEEAEAEAEPVITAPVAKKKSGAGSSFMRILLLLILGLVIIGGALYYINGPEQIEQVIQQIIGQQQGKSTESGRIALTNLEGKFINNQEVGELFVIRGEATNNYSEPRAAIQVKGVIFDQNGKPLLQKTIFCGNPINDQELQTLPFKKLEEMMGNQFGKALNNMKVNSKEAIPFTIAFRDLPRELSEFSVDVTSSKAATE